MRALDDILPMEAETVEALPKGEDWLYEPKWDGFRCLAYKKKNTVRLKSKSGKPLDRYFPEIVEALKKIKADHFILDGELVIDSGGILSFSDLQLRLHPAASRIEKLSKQSPATYILFDFLQDPKGKDISSQLFIKRRQSLEKFFKSFIKGHKFLSLSPQTSSVTAANKWLKQMKGSIDGIIAKNIKDVYLPEERIMRKYKPLRTADCVIGGFRYGTNSPYVGSLLLGLYDENGLLNHVGFTSGLKEKTELTKKLKRLIQKPGFTGKSPGGPSRWSTERSAQWEPLKPELVVEVSFDHVSDHRFRHGTKLLRFRPDKSPKQCKMEQIL